MEKVELLVCALLAHSSSLEILTQHLQNDICRETSGNPERKGTLTDASLFTPQIGSSLLRAQSEHELELGSTELAWLLKKNVFSQPGLSVGLCMNRELRGIMPVRPICGPWSGDLKVLKQCFFSLATQSDQLRSDFLESSLAEIVRRHPASSCQRKGLLWLDPNSTAEQNHGCI